MKKLMVLLIAAFVFALSGCGGGGGGGGNGNNTNNNNDNDVKDVPQNPNANVRQSVDDAGKTAPWKNEVVVEPSGNQIGNAKGNIDDVTALLLSGIAASGKKHKSEVEEKTIAAPVRGSMTYKVTYIEGEYENEGSFSAILEIKFNGYEDISYGLNGTMKYTLEYIQGAGENNSSSTVGTCAISYKDATGVFNFYMTYEDRSVVEDGVETITSKYQADDENYEATAVIQQNGDSVYTTVYEIDGVAYTSVTTTVGHETTYEVSHMEGGEKVVDSTSTAIYSVDTEGDDVTETYSYTYEEDGIVYTVTSVTVNGNTTTEVSHLDADGNKVIDSVTSSGYETKVVDGETVEVYSYAYTEDGILYTFTITYAGDTVTYTTSHIDDDGNVVIDDSSTTVTSYSDDGSSVESYSYTYEQDGIVYTYTSTTEGETTTYTLSHQENGAKVIDSYSTYTQTVQNGELVEIFVSRYTSDGIEYEATTTVTNDSSTTVIRWTENGVEHSQTY